MQYMLVSYTTQAREREEGERSTIQHETFVGILI